LLTPATLTIPTSSNVISKDRKIHKRNQRIPSQRPWLPELPFDHGEFRQMFPTGCLPPPLAVDAKPWVLDA